MKNAQLKRHTKSASGLQDKIAPRNSSLVANQMLRKNHKEETESTSEEGAPKEVSAWKQQTGGLTRQLGGIVHREHHITSELMSLSKPGNGLSRHPRLTPTTCTLELRAWQLCSSLQGGPVRCNLYGWRSPF
eukprot:359019-Chlamydomonas_euryale.AAC.3